MVHFKYKLDKSPIHGIGLFADQDIKKGQLLFTGSPLDINLPKEEFEKLDEKEKTELRWWGFFDKNVGIWHSDFDVSKFINHSVDGTVIQDPNHEDTYLIAARDIKQGEELTQNYLEFESREDLEKRGIKD